MIDLNFVTDIMGQQFITKDRCMKYIADYGTPYVMTMQPELIAYMCGYHYENNELSELTNQIDVPLTLSYVTKFNHIVEQLPDYQVWNHQTKLKGRKAEKEEFRLCSVVDKVHHHNNHVVRAWNDVSACLLLASNENIYYELLGSYGYFYGMLVAYRSFCKKHLKSEPILVNLYQFVLGDDVLLDEPFQTALQDVNNVAQGVKNSFVPNDDITKAKQVFWDAYKLSQKDFKYFTRKE